MGREVREARAHGRSARLMRVKSSHPESQGDFVIINECNFDPSVHERFDPEPLADDAPTANGIKAVHRGRGNYSVMDGDAEIVKGLSKDDALAFNDMDEEGKANFVAEKSV
jgi:hypothetical protein